jgi:membrane protein
VLDRYSQAGGGLLAGGLAYAALFAIVPALLLIAGVAGIVIVDPAGRASIVDTISGVMPPVRDLVNTVLAEADRDAAPVSLLGVGLLLWGASRFVVAFQDAMAIIMGGARRRSLLRSNLGALLAVIFLVGAILVSTVVAGLSAFLDAGESAGIVAVIDQGLSLALGLMPIVVAIVAVCVAYRVVPLPGPSWRALLIPAFVVGVVLTMLARVFIFVAPRLIGAAALLGTLASIFAALAWLALSFQAVLIGAAWVADREALARAARSREEPAPEEVP